VLEIHRNETWPPPSSSSQSQGPAEDASDWGPTLHWILACECLGNMPGEVAFWAGSEDTWLKEVAVGGASRRGTDLSVTCGRTQSGCRWLE
jgi:hypothetical protein